MRSVHDEHTATVVPGIVQRCLTPVNLRDPPGQGACTMCIYSARLLQLRVETTTTRREAAMTENKPSHKPWYRKWWGILIVICIWPYFLTWYAWTRSRWSKVVRVAVTALSVVAVLISIGMAAASSSPQSPTTANSTNAMTNNQSATGGSSSVPTALTPQEQAQFNEAQNGTQNQPSSPTPPQPQTLLDISGQGTKQTQQFTTTVNWTLAYNYDCSSFGTQGNFQVVVYNSDGSMDTNDMLVNQLGMNGSDTEYYYDAGTFYLSVNSECSWHVIAKG